MATIKVKFRPSTSVSKEGAVYYQVIHERRPRQIATDYKVFPYEWNLHRSTVTCSNDSCRKDYILSVRERIKMDLDRLTKVLQHLEKTRVSYSADDIVEEYERILMKNSLFRYMEGQIARLKRNGKVRTAETYRATLNSFRKYRGDNDIMLECLSREVMESYESWQRGRGVAPNTISFYTRILRAVYNRAVDDELTEDRTPFRKVYTGTERTVKRALPMDVIKQIRHLDLAFNPRLDYARDMFILSFMLRGMSFIDMAFLRKSDLRNGYVSYRRRKTGQLLMIEWTADMQMIVNKYGDWETDYLLPIIRNSNSVPVYAYRNAANSINRHLKSIAAMLGISTPLTMYVARHSWASVAKAKGIPVSVISEGMGHDSEMTTRIYLASLDTSVIDRANYMIIKDLDCE